jgi:ribose 5-phosphate isomerase A
MVTIINMNVDTSNAKRIAAEEAVKHIKDGMVVGLGTGSTIYFAIQKIGKKVKEGLKIQAIATSLQTESLAREQSIPLTTFAQVGSIDLTIDGADEVDTQFNLVKGGGGALLREKIVAAASKEFIVVADEIKLVAQLGTYLLPVEVVPFGMEWTMQKLQQLGCYPTSRMANNKVFITDNGNNIIDCNFKFISQPLLLHDQINSIVGVVENGLFINMANKVIVGYFDGTVTVLENKS